GDKAHDRPKPKVRTGWPTDEIASLRRLLPLPSPGDLIRSMIEDVLHGAPGTLRIAGEDRVADGGMDVQASPELAARLALRAEALLVNRPEDRTNMLNHDIAARAEDRRVKLRVGGTVRFRVHVADRRP